MKVMLDCKEVSRLISAGQDQDLPAGDRARMRLHFVMCQTCRNVDEQMQFIRRAMKRLDVAGDDPPPPPPPTPPRP
jgi:predicted anti-sigma-YlaC factor YlaD